MTKRTKKVDVEIYESFDGKKFDTMTECLDYETQLEYENLTKGTATLVKQLGADDAIDLLRILDTPKLRYKVSNIFRGMDWQYHFERM